MIEIKHKDCELLKDMFGNKPRMFMQNWKKYNFGLFKIWVGHQYYNLIDKDGSFVLDIDGKPFVGKHCNIIEIKGFWE